jgi:hypothetical protein
LSHKKAAPLPLTIFDETGEASQFAEETPVSTTKIRVAKNKTGNLNRKTHALKTQDAGDSLAEHDFAQVYARLRERFAAFQKVMAEAEEFMNPFSEQSQTPPLLFCYILWCIGELPQADADRLRESTTQLRREYHQPGDWQNIVASVMGLSDRWQDQIRKIWKLNPEIIRDTGVSLTPTEFAKKVIERNFHIH